MYVIKINGSINESTLKKKTKNNNNKLLVYKPKSM